MSIKTEQHTYIVKSINDYNTIIALIKEMNACVLKVGTSSGNIADSDVIKITAQGDENHLLFIDFLFKKYKDKINKLKSIFPDEK